MLKTKGINSIIKKVILICSIAALIVGCGNSEQKSMMKTGEKFLTIFFTSNYENRYTDFIANDTFDHSTDFKTQFLECASSECIKTMTANREPLQYDKEAMERGVEISVKDVKITEMDSENATFDDSIHANFEVILEENDGNQVTEKTAKGQLTFTNEKPILVDHYHISSVE